MSTLFHQDITAAVPVTLVAETAVYTSPLIATANPSTMIRGHINFTPGTGATQVQVRIKKGVGTTGSVIGRTDNIGVTAGVPIQIPFGYDDNGGWFAQGPAGAQVSITLQQVGASADGTVNGMDVIVDDIAFTA